MEKDLSTLYNIAEEIRKNVFKTICRSSGGHIASSFSIVEILTALYFGNVLNYDSKNPNNPERDRFVLSKGHGAVALYATLFKAGYFGESTLNTYCHRESKLGSLANMDVSMGIEASTGSLGHGFGFAGGIAWTGKNKGKKYKVYALIGDGECQEGSIWEGALFASQNCLDNFITIIDFNKLQAMDRLEKIVSIEPLAQKWEAFGWEVKEVDGHDIKQIIDVLTEPTCSKGKPRVVIAHTIKGKGVGYMENSPTWHYRFPNGDEMETAMLELGIRRQELMSD